MDEIQKHLYVLIMAGGGGTRLWPLSTESYSKQFLQLFGRKSLLQSTYDRSKSLVPSNHVWIATTEDQIPLIRKQLPQINRDHYSIEPMRKNTAWGLGLAAAYIYKQDPQAVIINLPADHLINDTDSYRKYLNSVVKAAWETQKIVLIGLTPTHLHTGYEYIHKGVSVGKYDGIPAFKVNEFVKRSDLDAIVKLLKAKNGLWNAGMFTWTAQSLFNEFKVLEPKIYSGLSKIIDAIGTTKEKEVIQQVFQMAQSTQIDFVLTNRSKNMLVVEGKFDWTDVGDWSVVWEKSAKDKMNNVILGNKGEGNFLGVESTGNIFILDKKFVATAGLNDMVVIDTPKVLMICPKSNSQAVKKIVEMLKEQQLTKYL